MLSVPVVNGDVCCYLCVTGVATPAMSWRRHTERDSGPCLTWTTLVSASEMVGRRRWRNRTMRAVVYTGMSRSIRLVLIYWLLIDLWWERLGWEDEGANEGCRIYGCVYVNKVINSKQYWSTDYILICGGDGWKNEGTDEVKKVINIRQYWFISCILSYNCNVCMCRWQVTYI